MAVGKPDWVRETGFGRWFLSTKIWYKYVLQIAISDFKRLTGHHLPEAPRILDAGCGQGQSFPLIDQFFAPKELVGIDIDIQLLANAKQQSRLCQCDVHVANVNAVDLGFSDNAFDIIFCHQLLHHVSKQQEILAEFYRVLKPGGVILVSESCKSFITTFPVRLLFRHPMHVQKSAPEYMDLVEGAGYTLINTESSAPWWSLLDAGLAKKWGLRKRDYTPTEVLVAAQKPC